MNQEKHLSKEEYERQIKEHLDRQEDDNFVVLADGRVRPLGGTPDNE